MSLRESLVFIWKKLLVWTGLRNEDYPDDGDCALPAVRIWRKPHLFANNI